LRLYSLVGLAALVGDCRDDGCTLSIRFLVAADGALGAADAPCNYERHPAHHAAMGQ
jgi:hypothetical protein